MTSGSVTDTDCERTKTFAWIDYKDETERERERVC